MKLKVIGSNQTEVTTKSGDAYLFSYNTLVAARTMGGAFKTDKKWSRTTQKHINAWGGKNFATKPQEWFDGLSEVVR
jgi:hypothetical protein